jgi:hypothetical protein
MFVGLTMVSTEDIIQCEYETLQTMYKEWIGTDLEEKVMVYFKVQF